MDLELRLDAVIVAVTDGAPRLLAIGNPDRVRLSLPSATLSDEATLDLAVRAAIEKQAGLDVRYVEQLYTFGDVARREQDHRTVSIAYLALVKETELLVGAEWLGYYDLLPWEDHRVATHSLIESQIKPELLEWAGESEERLGRISVAFGDPFDGVRVLDRYELMYEAKLVEEWWADQQMKATSPVFGDSMHLDSRRIAATALGRIRGKLSYRPVVFDLLSESFTLLELQRCVEALAGVQLHKQNFRRLIERAGLVEGTGERASHGGRPAELFRYRSEVQLERSRLGVGQPYR
ncbi:MAG: NAD regulator [Acidimicrobiia bacterium]|nr:NAD regulator [Acidimicrobiia bacterium]